jgi:hypothetical protein
VLISRLFARKKSGIPAGEAAAGVNTQELK